MAQAQGVVPKARGQTQSGQVGQIVGSDVAVDAQLELAVPAQALIGGQGLGAVVVVLHALVVQGGDAQAMQLGHALGQGGVQLGGGDLRDVVGDQTDGQFPQEARGLACGVLVDHAAIRVGRTGGDPRQGQGRAVDHGSVHVAAPEDGWVIRAGYPVQIVAVREAGLAPAALVPAVAYDPTAGGKAGRPLSDLVHHLGFAAGGGQFHLQPGDGPIVEVDVGIAQPRQGQPPAQVNQLGLGPGQGQDLRIPAHGQDAAIGHSHGLGPRLLRVDGVDFAGVIDGLGCEAWHGVSFGLGGILDLGDLRFGDWAIEGMGRIVSRRPALVPIPQSPTPPIGSGFDSDGCRIYNAQVDLLSSGIEPG